uniref:C2H2-type domain-containing protein n=1 Tax=Lepeophtheirus salmonis TaxID=72036 RepID=A0A0K2THI2_LEPSM
MSEFNFACTKCPRTFKLSEFYEKHKKVHELKKQHVCNICGFVYGAAKGLEGHLKTHQESELHAAESKIETPSISSTPPPSTQSSSSQSSSPAQGHGTGNYRVYENIPDVNDGAYQNGIGYFVCELCSREFSGLNSLKKHMPIHGRSVQHKCDTCGFVYGKKEYLTEHARLHNGFTTCEICGQGFTKVSLLKEHLKCHRNITMDGSKNESVPFKCHICQDVYPEASQLKIHLDSAHTPTKSIFQCDTCPASFVNAKDKNKHMINEHRFGSFFEKLFWCPLCNQGFTRHYNLKMHLYKTHGKETIDNNFSSEELTEILSPRPSNGKDSVNRSVVSKATHYFDETKGTQMLSCNLCSDSFLRKNDLWIHLESAHAAVLPVCRVCEDKFLDLAELKEHIELAHGKRKPGPASKTNAHPLSRSGSCQCLECGIILPERLSLSTHMKIVHSTMETDIGSHCELCQKDFPSLLDLEAHQKGKHPNLNKRLQNLRDALFPEPKKMKLETDDEGNSALSVLSMSSVSSLVNDARCDVSPSKLRSSTACPVCGVVLSPKTNINVHLRTHSGDRPYTCVLCLNKFRQKAHLMKHFRCAHHQKMPPFVCQFCGCESFSSSNDLYRHITDAHKAETDLIAMNSLQQRPNSSSQEYNQDQLINERDETDFQDDFEEDVQYVPIMEDFYFEDMIIHPCYVVIPFVSDEEIEAACSKSQQCPPIDDFDEDQGQLTIDEGSYDENALESSKNPDTPFTGEQENFNSSPKGYDADDIKGDTPHMGFYPDNISDFSLPFTLSGLWKKKADILGPNAMKQADLLEKQIKKINDYEKRQAEKRVKSESDDGEMSPSEDAPVLTRSHTPDQIPQNNNNYVPHGKRKSPSSPPDLKYQQAKINLTTSLNDEDIKFDSSPYPSSPGKGHRIKTSPHKAPDANVSKYESQIQHNHWPVECIKCDLQLNDLQFFNIHMNDHWTGDKCCPVCKLLINSKRFNFKQHLKIHTGEKPFVCDICKRSFRQKAHMVKHVTTHRSLPAAQIKVELPAGLSVN